MALRGGANVVKPQFASDINARRYLNAQAVRSEFSCAQSAVMSSGVASAGTYAGILIAALLSGRL